MRYYKGKYLIAIYDENDMLIDVGCNANEITKYKIKSLHEMLARQSNGKSIHKKLFLIDITEKHDDIFSFEDELFLKTFPNSPYVSTKEHARSLGISKRTYERKIKALKLPHKEI